MDDDISKKYERSAYNYIQVSLKDKDYKDADPGILALHLQQFSLYNIGIKSWEETAEILLIVAGYVREMKHNYTHPIWLAMYRHVKNAPDAQSAGAFISKGILKKSIEHKDWNKLPDTLKFEGLIFASKMEGVLPSRFASVKTFRSFFKSSKVACGCLLAVCAEFMHAGRRKDLQHCVDLLKQMNPGLFDLDDISVSGFLFAVSRFRRSLHNQNSEFEQSRKVLTKTWGKAILLPMQPEGRKARFEAIKFLYQERLQNAALLQDEQAKIQAHNNWKSYLLKQIDTHGKRA
ncbi:MAG: hypothetical protein JKY25_08455 [Robiginitomaculum sp.]|nr:hypothetical protein [Robiginitomaculum sp.]